MLPTETIKFVAIEYCNKNFVAIEFCCNKRFLLLLKILYCQKKKNCSYNLLQHIFCYDRLPLETYCNKIFVAIGYCNSFFYACLYFIFKCFNRIYYQNELQVVLQLQWLLHLLTRRAVFAS